MLKRTLTVAAIVIASSAALAAGFLGPLNPPEGPVASTSPSLRDLADQLDRLAIDHSTTSRLLGPWQTASFTGADDDLAARVITEGPTWLHKIIVHHGAAVVFDGPGEIDSDAAATNGDVVAAFAMRSMGADQSRITLGETFDIICDAGLRVSFIKYDGTSSVTVLYREIPPETLSHRGHATR